MNTGYVHVARIISSQKIYGLFGLKHQIVEMRGCVTDAGQTNNKQTVKIELLSRWMLEAEFCNMKRFTCCEVSWRGWSEAWHDLAPSKTLITDQIQMRRTLTSTCLQVGQHVNSAFASQVSQTRWPFVHCIIRIGGSKSSRHTGHSGQGNACSSSPLLLVDISSSS